MRPLFLLTASIYLLGCASATLTDAGRSVRLVSSSDEVAGCQALGTIRVGAMCCDVNDVENALRNKATQQGATHIVFEGIDHLRGGGTASAYKCDMAKLADLELQAAQPVTCTAGADCEMKWAKAIEWLQNNSHWKFRNVTDNLVTTEGPLETVYPAYELTRMPAGDGKTYRINLRAACGRDSCTPSITTVKVSFVKYVNGG